MYRKCKFLSSKDWGTRIGFSSFRSFHLAFFYVFFVANHVFFNKKAMI